MKIIFVVLLAVMAMANTISWIADRVLAGHDRTHVSLGDVRRRRYAQSRVREAETKINLLLQGQPTGSRSLVSERLGFTNSVVESSNRTGGAFHPASAQAEQQRQTNELQRTNNPTVNRFSSLRAIRRYNTIYGFDDDTTYQSLIEDEKTEINPDRPGGYQQL